MNRHDESTLSAEPPTNPFYSRSVLAAAAFTALYMAAATVAAISKGNTEFLFYGIVMAVLIALLLLLHGRVRLSGGVIWLMAVWGALHMAGGLVPVPPQWAQGEGERAVLYSLWLVPAGGEGGWLKYDNVVHAFGFGAVTWLCWQAMRGAVKPTRGRPLHPTPGLMVLCIAAAMGFGALNEIIEFLATRLTTTNVGGYLNTSLDLLANAIGAIVAAVVIVATRSRPDVPAAKEPAATSSLR